MSAPSDHSDSPTPPSDLSENSNQRTDEEQQPEHVSHQNQSYAERSNRQYAPNRRNMSFSQPNNAPQPQLNATFTYGNQQEKGHYNPHFYNRRVFGASANRQPQIPQYDPTRMPPPIPQQGIPTLQGVPAMAPTYQGIYDKTGVPSPQYPVLAGTPGYVMGPNGPVPIVLALVPMQQGHMNSAMGYAQGHQNMIPQGMAQGPPPVQPMSAPQQQDPSVPMPQHAPPASSATSSSQPTSTSKPFPHGMLDAPVFEPRRQSNDDKYQRLEQRCKKLEEELTILREQKSLNTTQSSANSERKTPADGSMNEASAPGIQLSDTLYPLCDMAKNALNERFSKLQTDETSNVSEHATSNNITAANLLKTSGDLQGNVYGETSSSSIKEGSAWNGKGRKDSNAKPPTVHQKRKLYSTSRKVEVVSDEKPAEKFSKTPKQKPVVPKEVIIKTRVPVELKTSKDSGSVVRYDAVKPAATPTSSLLPPLVDLSRLNLGPSEPIANVSSSGTPLSNDLDFPLLNETLRETEPFTEPKKKNTVKAMTVPAAQYYPLKPQATKKVENVTESKEDDTTSVDIHVDKEDTSISSIDKTDISLDQSSSNTITKKQGPRKENRKKAQKQAKKEAVVQEPLELITEACLTEYVVSSREFRSIFLSFRKQREKLQPFQDSIISFLEQNVMSFDSKKDWTYLTAILKRRIKVYTNATDPDSEKMVELLTTLEAKASDVIFADVSFLYMKDMKESFLRERERQYYLMVQTISAWNPHLDPKSVVTVADVLPICKELYENAKFFFVDYIRKQRNLRLTGGRIPPMIRPIEVKCICDFSVYTACFVGWTAEKTTEFINERLEIICDPKNPSPLLHMYKPFYQFLLDVKSIIVDYDVYWVTRELQAKRMKSEDVEKHLFELIFAFETS